MAEKKLVNVRLDAALVARVDEYAKAQGMTKTSVFESALLGLLDGRAQITKSPGRPQSTNDKGDVGGRFGELFGPVGSVNTQMRRVDPKT